MPAIHAGDARVVSNSAGICRHQRKLFGLFQVGGLTSEGTDIGFIRRHNANSVVSPSESFSSPDRSQVNLRRARGRAVFDDERPAASSSSKGQTSRKAGTQSPGPVAARHSEAGLPKGCWLPLARATIVRMFSGPTRG